MHGTANVATTTAISNIKQPKHHNTQCNIIDYKEINVIPSLFNSTQQMNAASHIPETN